MSSIIVILMTAILLLLLRQLIQIKTNIAQQQVPSNNHNDIQISQQSVADAWSKLDAIREVTHSDEHAIDIAILLRKLEQCENDENDPQKKVALRMQIKRESKNLVNATLSFMPPCEPHQKAEDKILNFEDFVRK